MKFKLEIELGTEAMQTEGDVQTALEDARENFSFRWSRKHELGDNGVIFDRNDNVVGHWQVVPDAQPSSEVTLEKYTHEYDPEPVSASVSVPQVSGTLAGTTTPSEYLNANFDSDLS